MASWTAITYAADLSLPIGQKAYSEFSGDHLNFLPCFWSSIMTLPCFRFINSEQVSFKPKWNNVQLYWSTKFCLQPSTKQLIVIVWQLQQEIIKKQFIVMTPSNKKRFNYCHNGYASLSTNTLTCCCCFFSPATKPEVHSIVGGGCEDKDKTIVWQRCYLFYMTLGLIWSLLVMLFCIFVFKK